MSSIQLNFNTYSSYEVDKIEACDLVDSHKYKLTDENIQQETQVESISTDLLQCKVRTNKLKSENVSDLNLIKRGRGNDANRQLSFLPLFINFKSILPEENIALRSINCP